MHSSLADQPGLDIGEADIVFWLNLGNIVFYEAIIVGERQILESQCAAFICVENSCIIKAEEHVQRNDTCRISIELLEDLISQQSLSI